MVRGMDELLSIGRFSRLSGLSVGALRHYDELGLLRPAAVDEWTAYRSYRREQLGPARTIRRLRDLEIPLEAIRDLLAADDPQERRRILVDQRDRVQARTWRLQRVLHVLSQMTTTDEETEPMVAKQPIPTELDDATTLGLVGDAIVEILSGISAQALRELGFVQFVDAQGAHIRCRKPRP